KLSLEREFRKLGLTNTDLLQLAKSLDFRTVDDLWVALGCGDISLGRIINELRDPTLEPIPLAAEKKEKIVASNAVMVVGLKGILTNFARCCNPAAGDDIVGYITRGRGATIHRRDCPNMMRTVEKERIVKVSWGEPHQTYPLSIVVKAYDRQGLMNEISGILVNEGINLDDIHLQVSHSIAMITLDVEISDIGQLSRVLTKIENLPNVIEAQRVRPG
ncbi:MAG: bifunctional (p)ppGpp synthetase/guanosine-3',5'-bis(diphosphate) 3'-pyrophosphohydrolase, partial [Anaerolineae bacterium]|nr:bifunctional (p)ppGpp synthetase/guanosine-3',5'-bis(diphosphate) 3'-pyrophosphohydrolase [Anaerolineae bacterium]